MSWKGHYYFDKTFPFGLRSAPFLFNQLSDALECLVRHHLKIPSIIHILDDFFIVQAPPPPFPFVQQPFAGSLHPLAP